MADDLIALAAEKAFAPRLKLFLSADIVGSTSLKQRYKEDIRDVVWPNVIQGFYKEFIEEFSGRWRRGKAGFAESLREREVSKLFGPSPKFWKTVGDEVLFWKEITHETQVWPTLAIWAASVAGVREYFKLFDEEEVQGLDIKTCAWIGGFPVRNRLLKSSVSPLQNYVGFLEKLYESDRIEVDESYDFVGPAMDIGFRLAGFATAKRMSIDVATAYLLGLSTDKLTGERKVQLASLMPETIGLVPKVTGEKGPKITDRLKIFYSGSEILKGVGSGTRYPKFWLNLSEAGTSEALKEELIFPDGRQCVGDSITSYCAKFYEERSRFLSRPFIAHKSSSTNDDKPDFYDGVVSQMRDQFIKHSQQVDLFPFTN